MFEAHGIMLISQVLGIDEKVKEIYKIHCLMCCVFEDVILLCASYALLSVFIFTFF